MLASGEAVFCRPTGIQISHENTVGYGNTGMGWELGTVSRENGNENKVLSWELVGMGMGITSWE